MEAEISIRKSSPPNSQCYTVMADQASSPPSLLTLLEIRRHYPEVFQNIEVFVDCGIRRGTDVVKALCLGAKAVGLGRPFLYSLTYGQEGVEHYIDSKLQHIFFSIVLSANNTQL